MTSRKTTHGESRVRSYKDWTVGQKGIRLVKDVYQLTGEFSDAEKYGLVAQMRRAAVSIPSNIAEGQARHSTGEFIQFVSHAEGSIVELETQLMIAVELGYCAKSEAAASFELITELRKMLNALRRTLVTRH